MSAPYYPLTTPFVPAPSCFKPTLDSDFKDYSTYKYDFRLPGDAACSPRPGGYPVAVWSPGICPSGYAPQELTSWEETGATLPVTTALCCPSGFTYSSSLYTVATTSVPWDPSETYTEYYGSCHSTTTVTKLTPTGTQTLESGAPTGTQVIDVWAQDINVAWQANDSEIAKIMSAQVASNQTMVNSGSGNTAKPSTTTSNNVNQPGSTATKQSETPKTNGAVVKRKFGFEMSVGSAYALVVPMMGLLL